MTRITRVRVEDIRFPTSLALDGSDAMNPDPDYSAAYVILETDTPGLEGHGLTFTIGRGNEICCTAIAALEPLLVGLELEWIAADYAQVIELQRSLLDELSTDERAAISGGTACRLYEFGETR